jgi:hypothetical protein
MVDKEVGGNGCPQKLSANLQNMDVQNVELMALWHL